MKVAAPTVSVVEVPGEGLLAFLNKPILIFASNYIYTGILVGVNDTCVKLQHAKIVYETGDFNNPKYKDAQTVGDFWYVNTNSIESFGAGK